MGSSIMGWSMRIIALAAIVSTAVVIIKKKRNESLE